MTKLENALVWLYVKTWGKFGDHVAQEKDLWKFGGDDLETVIMGLAFPRKKEKKAERVQALTDLIMEKFEQDRMAFYEWAAKIHEEAIETLLESIELDVVNEQATTPHNPQPVKILEWDSGSAYRASVTNAIFKTTGYNGYARAAVVMSTQSETVFEWSVKVLCYCDFRVGIASQLRQEANEIFSYDENAILYGTHKGGPSNPGITVGSNRIHSHPAHTKNGDVVHFRFQPQTKKFVVRLNEHEYEIDLRDNVNYFPVVQRAKEAHLIA